METHYETLGVVRTATIRDIISNYHDIARISHPDKTIHLSPIDRARHETYFKKVLAAYEVLKDKDKRQEYDLTLPPVPTSLRPTLPTEGHHAPAQNDFMASKWARTSNRHPDPCNWSQTWAPDPTYNLAEEPEDVNPSLEEDMGYACTRNIGSWSYTIRLSKRFNVTGISLTQRGFPMELHLHLVLDICDDVSEDSQDIEDIYIAVQKSPAVCTKMHTYFQNNRSGKSAVSIVITADGEPSTPQCRPNPWEFPFDADLSGWVPPAELEDAHVIGTYTTFSNDDVEPPSFFGGTALVNSKRLALEEHVREANVRCGQTVFTKRAAVKYK